MTAHTHPHESAAPGARPDPRPGGAERAPTTSSRRWWVGPAIATGVVVAALVITGVLSFSTVLYFGFFGGMLFMHAGGHGGHGGHGGGGHGGHGGSSSGAQH